MKQSIIYILLFTLLFSSCDEKMPVIPPVGPQEAGARVMLIEEFTGVQCVNCPQGSDQIENLLGLYPNNLIAISIHAGEFSPPFSNSNIDFRTEDGDNLISFLGEPFAYPAAVINRKNFNGSNLQNVGQNRWPGILAEEVNVEPTISVSLSSEYDANTRELSIDITGVANQAINEVTVMNVMITENNIVDVQLTPEGKKDDYVHKHVFREMITPLTGDQLASSMTIGDDYNKSYNFTLPDSWVAENCNVVAFVSYTGADKNILQAAEAHLIE